ncbi:MAG: tetratricopeptide repeat protein [Armatimonadota bacterium]
MYCTKCNSDYSGVITKCPVCDESFDSDPDVYFKAGMDAMTDGDLEKAVCLLRNCIHLNPVHLSGKYNLGLALSLLDKCDEAMEHYVVVAQQDSQYPGIYTALGQASFGRYMNHAREAEWMRKAMIQLLKKAIEQDPDDIDAHFSLGNAYMAIGYADKAITWLKRALDLQPNSPAIYFSLAKAFKMLQKFSEAADMANKSMQLAGPDDPFIEDIHNLLCELS